MSAPRSRTGPDSLAARLRAQRYADNLSQASLAERFGVRQQTVGAWEAGERPQAKHVPELVRYLGLPDEMSFARLFAVRDSEEALAPGVQQSRDMMMALTEQYFALRASCPSDPTSEVAAMYREDLAALRDLIRYHSRQALVAAEPNETSHLPIETEADLHSLGQGS